MCVDVHLGLCFSMVLFEIDTPAAIEDKFQIRVRLPVTNWKIFKLVIINLVLYNEHIVYFSVETEGESEPALCFTH